MQINTATPLAIHPGDKARTQSLASGQTPMSMGIYMAGGYYERDTQSGRQFTALGRESSQLAVKVVTTLRSVLVDGDFVIKPGQHPHRRNDVLGSGWPNQPVTEGQFDE